MAFARRGEQSIGQFVERAFGICGVSVARGEWVGQCLGLVDDDAFVAAIEAHADSLTRADA